MCISRQRVARLMRQAGIQGVSKRRGFTVTTRRDKRQAPAGDLVNRRFHASDPNQLWVADMTYVPTWTGFLYLAVVIDVWSRRVVGWAMGERMTADLVLAALNMALEQRKPKGVIHHSDQVSQGVFNRSSQHWVVGQILDIRSRLQLGSSSQAFSGVWCSARELRHGSLGLSTVTDRCPSGSIAAEGRWCSR